MERVFILAASSLREQWRNRAWQVAMLFAGVMLYFSVLLGILAADQELRALLDFGLSFIELMALAAAIFGAATGVLREMETKSIYLILSRPVSRLEYLLGRYLGLVLSMLAAVSLMAGAHLILLLLRGWSFRADYLLALYGIALKVAVAAAVATFFALFSTSALSALVITAVLWTLGHFIAEMRFLAARGGLSLVPLAALIQLVPNLQLFNFRDRLDIPASAAAGHSVAGHSVAGHLVAGHPVALATAYAAVYCACCLALAYALIRRKDF